MLCGAPPAQHRRQNEGCSFGASKSYYPAPRILHPAFFRSQNATSANTAAAVAGVGTDVILYATLVGVGFAWTNNIHLAKLVRTTILMRDARVAAAFVICCTSACSSLALSLTLHSAGIGDGEKQDSEE